MKTVFLAVQMVLLQNLPHNKFGVCLQTVRRCDSVILCCKLWDATNIDITQYILFKFHYTHFNAFIKTMQQWKLPYVSNSKIS